MNNFTRSFLVFLVICISTTGTWAQKIQNAIFWEVSGNGLSKPSYIFGTVRFIPSKDFFLNKEVKNKLKSCEIFATETLLDHHSLHELNKAAHLPHHQSLKDLLTSDQYTDLKKIFIERLDVSNIKFEMVYNQFKPIVLSTTMTRLSIGKDVMYYEAELVKIAKKEGLITLGLETTSREIEAMESFRAEHQVDALVHTIKHFDRQLLDYKKLIAAYKLGNLHNTLEYTLHPSENDMDFKKSFYSERNKEWIPHMEKYMRQSSAFFAIGVAHLADRDGIIRLLRAKGYVVKPVTTI